MTDRLADVSARIDSLRQLGSVVNAIKGMAAARAHTALAEVGAVDSYAATIAAAMSSLTPQGQNRADASGPSDTARHGLLVFGAEQGFAGAFSERVLDAIGDDLAHPATAVFLIGTRGGAVAAARGLVPVWQAAMPSHTPMIPKLADHITQAIYEHLDAGRIATLDVIYAWWSGGGVDVTRARVFPIAPEPVVTAPAEPPMIQLLPADLLARLGADYLHALICKAALHAFSAENQARMVSMTSAASQIDTELDETQAALRRVRQEQITAEITELVSGALNAEGGGART